ncbi:hypothetical protein [Actinomadura alba]|uniref:Uncharacterized protein n=1 Tax=Actinomadura alba TaxID=406431 RepID=A0ABR7LHA8_9ACTN|nr:hypothetical protein [Actinomadura alba]MBC6464239.1 hypothetical protein [Actinomadura alba]
MTAATGGHALDSGWPDRSPLDIKIEQLQDEHPEYDFWLSRDQRLVVATRNDGAVGVDRTLVEDDIPSMRVRLERQAEQLERRGDVPTIAGRTF